MARKPTGKPRGRAKDPAAFRSVLINLTAQQVKALDYIVERARIQRSVLIREAIDDLLTKYDEILDTDARVAVLTPRAPRNGAKS